jgi:molybdate/tungstate transport system substrate-binding protein
VQPNMRKLFQSLLIPLIVVIAASAGCSSSGFRQGKDQVELKVIIAGSLLAPFQALEKEFERLNPDIDVQLEGHGSVQVIRSVTELGNSADLTVVADAQLIPLMMYSVQIPENNTPYADWMIKFSTNRLGIAYHDNSAYASEINAENWPGIISRPDITIGLADPRIDAMGYRTLMVIRMAEDYYRDDTIFERTIGSAFNPPIVITEREGISTINVPEVVRSTQPRVKMRSYSIQLMALLESGDLDYSFEYESVAKQRGLKFLALPPAIDLGSPDYEEQYQQVDVRLDFRRFASVIPNFKGTQIVYGLSIPKNAPHPQEAARFIEFLLGPDGRRIFEQSWQPLLPVPVCDNIQRLPKRLQSLFP